MRTLYRMFARGQYNFNAQQLPMKDKRHPNGYVERRGKAGQLGRSIYQRYQDFPHDQDEFGHFEADTVQGQSPSWSCHDLGRTSIQSHDCSQCSSQN